MVVRVLFPVHKQLVARYSRALSSCIMQRWHGTVKDSREDKQGASVTSSHHKSLLGRYCSALFCRFYLYVPSGHVVSVAEYSSSTASVMQEEKSLKIFPFPILFPFSSRSKER